MSTNLQTTILSKLIHDEHYARRVLPFVKTEYFQNREHKVLHRLVIEFISKYNKLPSVESLGIDLQNSEATEDEFTSASRLLEDLKSDHKVEHDWLINNTEKWCKDRAVFLAIMESIQIIDGKKKDITQNAIPDILQKALAINFDTRVGHDYINDYGDRFDFYHRVEEKIPFDIDMLNTITKGGLPRKTLNIILAGTGVGKSLVMCHMAAACLNLGKNVLYLTMEMSEEKIAERIDANLMNVPIDQLESMSKQMFENKITQISARTVGKLLIKEYPTASAHAGHFRALLNELKLKKDFTPDIIFIDYLNICASSRMKGLSSSVNTYSFIKAIAEEIRGLAVEFDVPIVSATQTTRSGYSNTDVELTDTSESFGLPATADLMIALISTEELEKMGQIMVKQLKNRYNDPTRNKRFIVGVDRAKMRLYDVDQKAQSLSVDPSDMPQRLPQSSLRAFSATSSSKDFSGIKV